MKEKKFDANANVGKKRVHGVDVITYSKEIHGVSSIKVEVGTTGIMGGGTAKGGRTFISIEDLTSSDMFVKATDDCDYHTQKVNLYLGGDSELENIIEALEFAITTLRNDMLPKSKNKKDQQRENFRLYLHELVSLYQETGKLRNMSSLQSRYKVSAVTQSQFFMLGLHKAAMKSVIYLSPEFCNKVYEYVLSKGKIEAPEYEG